MKKTTTEAELRAWLAQGLTAKDIAAKLDRAQLPVVIAIAVLGLGSRTSKKQTNPFDPNAALVMLRQGLSLKDVSKAQQYSLRAVAKKLNALNLPKTCAEYWRRESAKGNP